ncbi:MAG: diguanylate cyclase [Desulfobaccales bacterium]
MEINQHNDSPGLTSRRLFWVTLLIWTLAVAASLALNLWQSHRSVIETALHTARINYEKDILYRRWNASHEGVYVKTDKDTPPNPWLAHIPERDVYTPSGKHLTLVNPAYMTRQVYELGREKTHIKANITSLKPFNPERRPDPWEKQALMALEAGKDEVSSVEMMQQKPYLRLMRPLSVESACLNCHQGFTVGGVLGGISVSVPLDPLWDAHRPHFFGLWGGHLVMWLLGLGGLGLAYRRLDRDFRLRQQAEEAMLETNEKLKSLVYETAVQNQQTRIINEMTEALQCCRQQEEAYRALRRILPQLFPDNSGALYVFQDSRRFLKAAVGWGETPPTTNVFEPDDCLSLRRGQIYAVSEPDAALICPHIMAASGGPYLCVPLMAHGEVLGILHLVAGVISADAVFQESSDPLPSSIRQLARRVGEHLSLALANLELRESLHQQAIRDPLTGLFNRRYLEVTLERELSRMRRQDAPLGVVMLDVDHFKRFNDTYGHEAGDALLKSLGSFLKTHVRREDIPCRFGGEEFVLVLPSTPLEVLSQRAEELRRGVEQLKVLFEGRSLGKVTVSLGLAVFPVHGDSGEALLRAADLALYKAKESGRNRLVMATPLEPEKTSPPEVAVG